MYIYIYVHSPDSDTIQSTINYDYIYNCHINEYSDYIYIYVHSYYANDNKWLVTIIIVTFSDIFHSINSDYNIVVVSQRKNDIKYKYDHMHIYTYMCNYHVSNQNDIVFESDLRYGYEWIIV